MISPTNSGVSGLLFCILCGALISDRPMEVSAQPSSDGLRLYRADKINRDMPTNSPELVGIWRGAGITLTLDAQGVATLKQSYVHALIKTNKVPQDAPATQGSLRGLWWENHANHLRALCLFFDLTARCLPISISRLHPSSLAVRIGRQAQVILKRAPQTHPQSSPQLITDH